MIRYCKRRLISFTRTSLLIASGSAIAYRRNWQSALLAQLQNVSSSPAVMSIYHAQIGRIALEYDFIFGSRLVWPDDQLALPILIITYHARRFLMAWHLSRIFIIRFAHRNDAAQAHLCRNYMATDLRYFVSLIWNYFINKCLYECHGTFTYRIFHRYHDRVIIIIELTFIAHFIIFRLYTKGYWELGPAISSHCGECLGVLYHRLDMSFISLSNMLIISLLTIVALLMTSILSALFHRPCGLLAAFHSTLSSHAQSYYRD